MQFTQLLGIAMKNDAMLEVLERYDMSVMYDFDRTHENIDDLYWAASKDAGFQFRFDKDRILNTIFCYVVPREGFEAIDHSLLDVPIFETFDDAKQACIAKSIPYKASPGEPGSPGYKWWIKFDFGQYTAHYQYKEAHLIMITLSAKANT